MVRSGSSSQSGSDVVEDRSSVDVGIVEHLESIAESRVDRRSSFIRSNFEGSWEGWVGSQVDSLVSAVVTSLVGGTSGGNNGNGTLKGSRGGVEVDVEPSHWWVEADGVDFVNGVWSVSVIVAFVVVSSSWVSWVSVEVSGRSSVVDEDADVGSVFWDPDSVVNFSHGVSWVPCSRVWKSDVGDGLASSGATSFVDGELTSGGASGQGGGDGVSASCGVVTRNISGHGDVDPVSKRNQTRIGVASRVESDGITGGISEVVRDGFSAWVVDVASFRPLGSTWNVVGVKIVSDVSSANGVSLSEGDG